MPIVFEHRVGYVEIVLSGYLSDDEADELSQRFENFVDQGDLGADARFAGFVWNFREATLITDRAFGRMAGYAVLFRVRGKPSVFIHTTDAITRYVEEAHLGTLLPTARDDVHAAQLLVQNGRRDYTTDFFAFLVSNHYLTVDQLRRITGEHKAHAGKMSMEQLLIDLKHFNWKTLLAAVTRYRAVKAGAPQPRPAEPAREAPPARPSRPQATPDAQPSPAAGVTTVIPQSVPAHPPTGEPAQAQGTQSEFAKPSLLGSILLEQKLITAEQLRIALEEQRTRGGTGKLGDHLVRLGFVTDDQIFQAIEHQHQRRASGPEGQGKPRPGSEFIRRGLLGEILVELGILSTESLKRALAAQRASTTGERLGSVLLRMGFVTRDQIFMALETQARRKGLR